MKGFPELHAWLLNLCAVNRSLKGSTIVWQRTFANNGIRDDWLEGSYICYCLWSWNAMMTNCECEEQCLNSQLKSKLWQIACSVPCLRLTAKCSAWTFAMHILTRARKMGCRVADEHANPVFWGRRCLVSAKTPRAISYRSHRPEGADFYSQKAHSRSNS